MGSKYPKIIRFNFEKKNHRWQRKDYNKETIKQTCAPVHLISECMTPEKLMFGLPKLAAFHLIATQ